MDIAAAATVAPFTTWYMFLGARSPGADGGRYGNTRAEGKNASLVATRSVTLCCRVPGE